MIDGLRILIVDDTPSDAELIRRELHRAEIRCQTRSVGNRADFETALDQEWDLLLNAAGGVYDRVRPGRAARRRSALWGPEPNRTNPELESLVPDTGCLLTCRMRPTELALDVLESHGQHGSIPTRVQIRVQTAAADQLPEPSWADRH